MLNILWLCFFVDTVYICNVGKNNREKNLQFVANDVYAVLR